MKRFCKNSHRLKTKGFKLSSGILVLLAWTHQRDAKPYQGDTED
jgi:hypothetical protein